MGFPAGFQADTNRRFLAPAAAQHATAASGAIVPKRLIYSRIPL